MKPEIKVIELHGQRVEVKIYPYCPPAERTTNLVKPRNTKIYEMLKERALERDV